MGATGITPTGGLVLGGGGLQQAINTGVKTMGNMEIPWENMGKTWENHHCFTVLDGENSESRKDLKTSTGKLLTTKRSGQVFHMNQRIRRQTTRPGLSTLRITHRQMHHTRCRQHVSLSFRPILVF